VLPLLGEKSQNRPLSKLNTGRFALHAMLPVIIWISFVSLLQAEYYRVDHDYIVNAAQLAKNGGCSQFHLVSSVGAKKNSSMLPIRTKVCRCLLFSLPKHAKQIFSWL